jgi:DNA-binding CsgD family transcriptional regulator
VESSLLEYARSVLDSQDVGQVLQRHLASIPDVVGADGYGIYVFDAEQGRPVHVAVDGVPDGLLESYEALSREGDPLFSTALVKQVPVHDRMLGLSRDWPQYASMMNAHGFSHAMVAPIHYNSRLVGSVNFARRGSSPFQETESAGARAATALVGAAVGHALQYSQARDCAIGAEWAARNVAVPMVVANARGELVVVTDAVREVAGDHDAGLLEQALLTAAVQAARGGDATQPTGQTWNGLGVRTVRLQDHRNIAMAILTDAEAATPRFDGLRGILTARELEVLEHAACGRRDQEIADLLFVTIHTVKQHLKNAYGKLGARSRTDAVRIGYASTRSAGSIGGL